MTPFAKAWSRRAGLAAIAVTLSAPIAGAGEISLTLDGGWHDLTNASQSAKAVFDGASGGFTAGGALQYGLGERSEERRVGKECRSRWSPYH